MNVVTWSGQNLLQFAAANIDSKPLEFLLQRNVFDVNYEDQNGRTALQGLEDFLTCKNSRILLKNGATTEGKDGKYYESLVNRFCEDDGPDCELRIYFDKLKFLGYKLKREVMNQLMDVKDRLDNDAKYLLELEELFMILCF